ncbi:MAG: UbiA family prenyltransferase [Candidatus Bathyarchaeota archaeon]|nr:UbiA family prenyltransferase [Candidatus Bathyarchaeota archaeon]
METLRYYVRLLRLERAVSAVFGVILTGVIVGDLTAIQNEYVIACLAVFFSALANFSLNDYQDIEIDRRNGRLDRPLAQGQIPPRTALIIACISSILAVTLSLLMNPIPKLMILVGLPVSLVYNLRLKRYLVLKNLFTGLANVGVVLIGALVSDTILEPLALYIATVGFFFSLSYEVMLDIADVEGDMAQGVDTLPGRFGSKNAAWFSIMIGVGAIFADPLPFFIHIDTRLFGDYLFLALILMPIVNRLRISRSLLDDQSPENIFHLKKRLFRNLQLGGLCYLIGFLV